MSLDSDKTLGGVGALLIAIGMIVPFLGLIGIILVIIAMKHLAEYYKDNSIYRDALYGLIFGIVAILAFGIFVFSLFFVTSVSSVTTTATSMMAQAAAPFTIPAALGSIGVIVLALFVVFIFFILEAIFFRRAFDALGARSGEGNFRTAGLLLLIGAVLTIVLIGILLIFVGWILAAVGYFSIKTQPAPGQAAFAGTTTAAAAGTVVPSQPFAFPSGKKYCPNCGAENTAEAAFCASCGNKL